MYNPEPDFGAGDPPAAVGRGLRSGSQLKNNRPEWSNPLTQGPAARVRGFFVSPSTAVPPDAAPKAEFSGSKESAWGAGETIIVSPDAQEFALELSESLFDDPLLFDDRVTPAGPSVTDSN